MFSELYYSPPLILFRLKFCLVTLYKALFYREASKRGQITGNNNTAGALPQTTGKGERLMLAYIYQYSKLKQKKQKPKKQTLTAAII